MTTNKPLRHVIGLLCLGVSLAACAEAVPGSPVAQPVPGSPAVDPAAKGFEIDYSGLKLTTDQQAQLADMARLRTWDPCSLIDPAAAAELGTVENLSLSDMDKCGVRYEYPEQGSATWSVSAEVGVSAREGRRDYQGEKIDGVDVSVKPPSDTRSDCSYLLPLSGQRSVKIRASWYSQKTPAPRPPCEAARTIAAPALQLIQAPKLRRETHRFPDTPLALGDPCGGLPQLPNGQDIIVDADYSSLYECAYKSGSERVRVRLEVQRDPTVGLRPPEVAVQLGKYAGMNRPYTRDCRAEIVVGEPVPPDPEERSSSRPEVFTVYASADTCAAANAVAVATADALPT